MPAWWLARHRSIPAGRRARQSGMPGRWPAGHAGIGPGLRRTSVSGSTEASRTVTEARPHGGVARRHASPIAAQPAAFGMELLHMDAIGLRRRAPVMEMVVVAPAEARGES